MLDLVLKQSPEDSKESQTARVLLYKLFYDQTEEGMTRFILNLIKSFDTHKQSKRCSSEILDVNPLLFIATHLHLYFSRFHSGKYGMVIYSHGLCPDALGVCQL